MSKADENPSTLPTASTFLGHKEQSVKTLCPQTASASSLFDQAEPSSTQAPSGHSHRCCDGEVNDRELCILECVNCQRVVSGVQNPEPLLQNGYMDVNHEQDELFGPGLMAEDAYSNQMAWWRAAIRRVLVKNLKTESKWLAIMQERIRFPLLDTYFVYTSTLGTHTFFMTMLPALFFFGHEEVGRGLLNVIGIGVYFSSLIKDSICSPRPFAPPVTRLTVGTHHLEYGFPSTHSTNSVSIALFLNSVIHELFVKEAISELVLRVAQVVLLWYTVSIVFGRLYCGMHSFMDCTVGVILGTVIWAVQSHWTQVLEVWLKTKGIQVPLVTVLVGAFMINRHTEPVDDCPCFEDAIAFVSVLMGSFLSKWWAVGWGYDKSSGFFVRSMPRDWPTWCTIAMAKMFTGIFIIFAWRLMAKRLLHIALPPFFRLLSTLFTLPNRRFYTPATDYERVPDEKSLLQHPIPSMIDLPAMNLEEDGVIVGKGTALLPRVHSYYEKYDASDRGFKLRTGTNVTSNTGRVKGNNPAAVKPKHIPREKVTHYDADVLTKAIVYAGIAFLATGLIPVMFETLGWGVYTFS